MYQFWTILTDGICRRFSGRRWISFMIFAKRTGSSFFKKLNDVFSQALLPVIKIKIQNFISPVTFDTANPQLWAKDFLFMFQLVIQTHTRTSVKWTNLYLFPIYVISYVFKFKESSFRRQASRWHVICLWNMKYYDYEKWQC
jgi:hypothetical protein